MVQILGKKVRASFFFLVFAMVSMIGNTLVVSETQAEKVTIFFTGLVRGNYGPCGCSTVPSGGFAKRSAYASNYIQKSKSQVLHVDLGGILLPRGPNAGYVSPEILNAIRDFPVKVVNLSPSDLFLWDQIASSDLNGHFISTHLSPLDSDRRIPERFRIVKVELESINIDIGFLGISDPEKVKPNSGFIGEDPVLAVSRIIDTVLKEADFLIVLADIPQQSTVTTFEKLAWNHSEIIAFLTTEEGYRLHEPRIINNAVLLSSVERGRYLGQLELLIDKMGRVQEFIPEFIQMSDELEEDPHFLKIQKTLAPYLP